MELVSIGVYCIIGAVILRLILVWIYHAIMASRMRRAIARARQSNDPVYVIMWNEALFPNSARLFLITYNDPRCRTIESLSLCMKRSPQSINEMWIGANETTLEASAADLIHWSIFKSMPLSIDGDPIKLTCRDMTYRFYATRNKQSAERLLNHEGKTTN